MKKLEKHAENLETTVSRRTAEETAEETVEMVSRRTAELESEKMKTDMLLYRMLPRSVKLR